MTQLVSIHSIVISDPEADLVFTGHYKKNGDPIVKKAQITITPGLFFEIDAPEAERLVAGGAARHPSETEIGLGKVILEDLVAYRETKSEDRP